MKTLIALTIFFLALQSSALAVPPTPFNSTRSYNNRSSTTYYQNNGSIAGRSYTTNNSTYWRDNKGRTLGKSYTTPSGNTYYFKTGK